MKLDPALLFAALGRYVDGCAKTGSGAAIPKDDYATGYIAACDHLASLFELLGDLLAQLPPEPPPPHA